MIGAALCASTLRLLAMGMGSERVSLRSCHQAVGGQQRLTLVGGDFSGMENDAGSVPVAQPIDTALTSGLHFHGHERSEGVINVPLGQCPNARTTFRMISWRARSRTASRWNAGSVNPIVEEDFEIRIGRVRRVVAGQLAKLIGADGMMVMQMSRSRLRNFSSPRRRRNMWMIQVPFS